MRILVTGGAGFIGNHLCAALVARGDDVSVIDVMETQAHPRRPEGVTFIGGMMAGSFYGGEPYDAVVHLAALVGVGQSQYEIRRYIEANTLDTARFLQALIRTPPERLIVASSMSVYGEGQYADAARGYRLVNPKPRTRAVIETAAWDPPSPFGPGYLTHRATGEEKPLMPASIYAITKRDQEEMCLVVGAAYGIPAVALRFGNVYGPGQALGNPYTGVISIFASRAANGLAPIVYEDGQQLRDFTHVSDIVQGILLTIDSDVQDEAINLGTGKAISVGEVASAISGYYSAPAPEYPGVGRAGDVRHCYLNVDKARRMLGFHAETPLWDGLADMLPHPDDCEPADTEYAERVLRTKGLV